MSVISTALEFGESAIKFKWVPKLWDLAWGGTKVVKDGEEVIRGGKAVGTGVTVARRLTTTRRLLTGAAITGAVADIPGVAPVTGDIIRGAVGIPADGLHKLSNAITGQEDKKPENITDAITHTAEDIGSKFSFGPGSLIAAGLLGVAGFLVGGAMAPIVGGILAVVGAVAGQPIMDALTKQSSGDTTTVASASTPNNNTAPNSSTDIEVPKVPAKQNQLQK